MSVRRFLLLLVPTAAAAVTLAGCGGSNADNSAGAGAHMMSGHASAHSSAKSTAATRNAADVMFAQGMIPHHEQAIEMADLAATRAADPKVKALAARIRAAQDPEITLMTGWLQGWRQPTGMPGMDMSGGMGGMMSGGDMTKLKAQSGRTFDRTFLTMMTVHHRGAIMMARAEQKTGRYPAAITLAGRIIAGQSAEVTTMAALLKQV